MKRLLIIDDDKILHKTLGTFLKNEGYEVLEAFDGPGGVKMAIENLPDLILCDILMPGKDGFEVQRLLSANFATRLIPFIFMTSKATVQEVRDGMEAGADDYLTKPLDLQSVLKVIKVRLEKYKYAVKRSQSTYHALFELGHDAIIIVNPFEGTIVDINHAGLEMLGYHRNELIGRDMYTIVGSDEFLIQLTLNLRSTAAQFTSKECLLRHHDGSLLPVQLSGTNFEIQSETLFFIIARNITDLRKKEKELADMHSRYRNILENTGEGIGLVDTNEVFVYTNQVACDIFGVGEEQLIGRNLLDFLNEDARREVFSQSSQRRSGNSSIYELEITRPDGKNRWLIVTASPQFDSEGNFEGTFGIFRDITERKESEFRLRSSEKRLRQIVDLTNEWIWEISPDWSYQYVSSKVLNILGYKSEELIGKSPLTFLVPEDVPAISEKLKSIAVEKKAFTGIEYRALHKDGRHVYMETSGVPMLDEQGNLLGYRGADREITYRKEFEQGLIIAKEKAEESDRLKSSILANISHELRTPLNGILGFSEILKEELGNSDYLGMIENIHNSGKRLMATLNSIITLSQLEAGKITVSMKEVALANSILSVVKSMGSLAIEKKLRLETEDVKPFTVLTDDQLFRQLLRQIMDNAIKFTESGIITVATFAEAKDDKHYVVVKVTDTGIGIEKDYFNLIFKEFRQISEGFGRKFQGSGIGLTISKKIIDLLKGRITVESQPGKGSSFSIWLPVSQADVMHVESVHTPFPDMTRASGTSLPMTTSTVLLIEDNLVNKELTELFLYPFFKVEHARNGTSAMEMIAKKRYEAILMEISSGAGLNGLDIAREIRKQAGYQSVPIIAITGYTLWEDQEMLIQAGCSNYITKPFDKRSLLKMLEEEILKNHSKVD